MDLQMLADRLAGWIREQVAGAGSRGAVLGLSGGVDSSVTAALCSRALPGAVLGLIMPIHSNPVDTRHALHVADRLGIPTVTVDLGPVFDQLVDLLGGEPGADGLAAANLKPRLRMMTLYYHANRLNCLVVGTGNRSELEVGYFTKYGDGGVDILPLGNLVKGQVRDLATHLGIPSEVVEKAPSAGLWEGQTDEGEMGISYRELDRYILTGEASPEVAEKIRTLHRRSAHKRALPLIPDF